MIQNGSLIVVGTGFRAGGDISVEALAHVKQAEKLLHVVEDPLTKIWLERLNRTAESLLDAYRPGRPRQDSYREMTDRILAPVRRGKCVCAAFYGHPGVFATPPHLAIAEARSEGFEASMLPGLSAEDWLFADLGVDPGRFGCQSFEATDFLIRHRRFDPRSALVLWQVGAIGVRDFRRSTLWNRAALRVLVEELARTYPRDHEVILYEASAFAICAPKILRVPLRGLARADLTVASTLYVPPFGEAEVDSEMLQRIQG